MYQVDHRLFLNSPVQYRDCELGFVSVRSLGGNLGPNLRAESIPPKQFDDLDVYQLCDVSTKEAHRAPQPASLAIPAIER